MIPFLKHSQKHRIVENSLLPGVNKRGEGCEWCGLTIKRAAQRISLVVMGQFCTLIVGTQIFTCSKLHTTVHTCERVQLVKSGAPVSVPWFRKSVRCCY